MSKNVIVGAVIVAALGAILFFHGHKRAEVKPVLAPTPIATPVPELVPAPAPVPTPPPNPCSIEHPCPTVKQTGDVKKPVYHRVLKGGKIGGEILCKNVPEVAKQYPPEKVIAYAKQYGLTPEQLSQLRLCLN